MNKENREKWVIILGFLFGALMFWAAWRYLDEGNAFGYVPLLTAVFSVIMAVYELIRYIKQK
ncbi:hypothetical protein [Bacillus marinisedimentorum]|uniref:hypothetical protein n=1 Tax=Bacillus marinisedimentorum TaxID=1821260 RepID=UPI0007DE7063|nr:hypothetical protein [Bacillus marinisedimentorum]